MWKEAQARGYEIFYPRLRVKPVNPRSRRIVPYFPGYLFVHMDLEEVGRTAIDRMPFSIGLVSFGGEPAVVPDPLVRALIRRLEAIHQDRSGERVRFKNGDHVRIEAGPFDGYEAIFDARISGQDRAKVLVEFLGGRFVRLDVSLDEIKNRS